MRQNFEKNTFATSKSSEYITRASLIPEILASGRSKTRKAARFAVYDATIIMAKPAQTIPSTRAEKLLGVPTCFDIEFSMINDQMRLTFSNARIQ